MIKYKIEPYFNGEHTVYSLKIDPPLGELSIAGGLFEDLDDFVEWLEELISRNVPDASEEGLVIYQPFLWGSVRSKIAEIKNGRFVGGAEFNTQEFLDVCYAWRDFLKSHQSK